jgi:hypothetical protein
VRIEFTKRYRHPIATAAVHSAAEGGVPGNYGHAAVNNKRHSECVDCHNPHEAKADPSAPVAPTASNRQRGVSRIEVTNGAAGTVPAYVYRAATFGGTPKEYEICFKCHSSWTTLPPVTASGGVPRDLAVQFNPNNRSYHPVEAAGKNANINVNAFISPWTAVKLMYCTDCHSSDSGTIRGPHGSIYNYLLKRDYRASSASRTMASAEICFDCHRYDTYANDKASSTIQGYSRFNSPQSDKGHVFHVGNKRYPCYACHETHGSTALPALMVVGRSPGLTAYTQTANGGTCTPTCHNQRSYTINYAR